MSATNATLKEMVLSILQENKQPLKPSEIAAIIINKYPAYCNQKVQKTKQSDFNLPKQIANQISAGSKKWMAQQPELKSSDETPRTYWREGINDTPQPSQAIGKLAQQPPKKNAQAEKALYIKLAAYLAGMHSRKLYPKRINEGKSSNTNGKYGNKHLHPDLVAMEDLMPTDLWSEKLKHWAAVAGAPQSKLWSFEVKVKLNSLSEAREAYLQALANSAWANYGYLVAVQISKNAFNELKVLHDLHGVGVILLNADNPVDDTIIKLSARERSQLDWGTCNRIASQNSDFNKFIEQVADFHFTQKTRDSDWLIPKVLTNSEED
jgi:hypothetical protein